MNYVLAVLGVLLALSTAGNAYFWHERDQLMTVKATTEQLQADTAKAAGACTASVQDLAKKGEERDKRLAAAISGVAPRVAALQQSSFDALAAIPDDPKDLCGSLARYFSVEIGKEAATRGQGAQP